MRSRLLHLRTAGLLLGLLVPTVSACGDDGGSGSSGSGDGGRSGDGGGGPSGNGGNPGPTTSSPSSAVASGTVTTATHASSSVTSGSGGNGSGGAEQCLDESVFEDADCDACIQDECCDAIRACLDDFDACAEDGVLDISGPLGASITNCMASECGSECGYGGICDSNLGYDGDTLNDCMSDACCEEFEDCTDGGADISACLLCFNGAGGDLCDPAIACANDSGCFCDDDEFTCADGSGCIPYALTCNGTSECDDDSDEDDCEDPCVDVASQCNDLVYTECTCAYDDPCNWSGDGACDDACADFNANPFDDSVDCGGVCSNQATECSEGQYTECTCGADDPCGWVNDGYCDIACEQVTGNAFDDTSDCSSGGLVISCSDPGNPLWLPECTCISNGGSGEPEYEGVSCDGGFGSGSFCCAEPGFPGAGNGCSCYDQQGPNWQCDSFVAEFCSCGYDSGPPGGGPCDNAPLPNGIPWLCCASASSNDCACFQNDIGQTCPGADDVVVSSCTNPPAGWQPPRQSCPAGTNPVLECSPGADCQSESDCPGDCWGSDPLYCPSCNAGSCETCAILSNGTVNCF